MRVSTGSRAAEPLNELISTLHASIAEMMLIFAETQKANREFKTSFGGVQQNIESIALTAEGIRLLQPKMLEESLAIRNDVRAGASNNVRIGELLQAVARISDQISKTVELTAGTWDSQRSELGEIRQSIVTMGAEFQALLEKGIQYLEKEPVDRILERADLRASETIEALHLTEDRIGRSNDALAIRVGALAGSIKDTTHVTEMRIASLRDFVNVRLDANAKDIATEARAYILELATTLRFEEAKRMEAVVEAMRSEIATVVPDLKRSMDLRFQVLMEAVNQTWWDRVKAAFSRMFN